MIFDLAAYSPYRMIKKSYSILIIIVTVMWMPAKGWSQVPSNPLGNDAFGLRWQQINTDRVKVIFPEGLAPKANRIVNIIHDLWDLDSPSIGTNKKKVPIVLHHQTVLANGFVTVAPFRSEFFMRPPQFDYATDWVDHLTIHEYQHIKQFNNTKKGITKIVSQVLGDWAWGGMIGLALPRWYYEGDATIAETAFSQSGRGRQPFFSMEYKALFAAGKEYGYEKAAARSLRDFVPDWYNLGYHMLSEGRKQYGPDIWAQVTDDAVRYKGLIYPFARSFKKRIGKSLRQLYDDTMVSIRQDLSKKLRQKAGPTAVAVNTKVKKTVTHYSGPQYHEAGHVIVQKEGYDQIKSFVLIDEQGRETRLTRPGFLLEGPMSTLSAEGNKIVWAELDWDIRRRYKRYADIMSYDIATQQKQRLSYHSSYYSPDLSADGQRIAAVHVNDELRYSLHILSVADGEILEEIPMDAQVGYSYPQWQDEDHVILLAKQNQSFQIQSIDLKSKTLSNIGEATRDQISHLEVADGQIYFSKAINDVNNIFVMDIEDGLLYQITDVEVGAFQPAVSRDGEWLAYSEFSAEGYDVKKIKLDPKAWAQRKSMKSQYQGLYIKELLAQEKNNFLQQVSTDSFEVSRFNKLSGLIKPHSLLANFYTGGAELNLLSDNVFSTLSADVSADYNFNENEWLYSAGLTYAELFPVLSLRYQRANRSALLYNYGGLTDTSFVQTAYVESWSENVIRGGVFVPLNFSQGNTISSVGLSGRFSHHSITVDQNFTDPDLSFRDTLVYSAPDAQQVSLLFDQPLDNVGFTSLDLSLSTRMTRFTALQHLNPRLGIAGFARLRQAFTPENIGGRSINLGAILYLPGIGPNHSLSFEADYQKERLLDSYRFSDGFNYPRGYDLSLRRDQFLKFGLNYAFPIWYPDVAVSGLAFLKRVKANLFYDHGLMTVSEFPFSDRTDLMRSAGIELGFDCRFLRLLEVDLGVRYSYLMDDRFVRDDRHQFDFFVLSIRQ